MLEPDPICTDEDGACRYLGCTPNRLKDLRQEGRVKKIGKNWYCYADLFEAVQQIRLERDAADGSPPSLTVVEGGLSGEEGTEEAEGVSEAEWPLGSQGHRSSYRTPKELLRGN